jgi:integrase
MSDKSINPKDLTSGQRMWLERGLFARKTATGEIRYGISYTDPNGRRVREVVGPTKTLARKVLAKRRTQIAEGRYDFPTKKTAPTFRAFAKEYKKDRESGLQDAARDALAIDAAVEMFGDTRLDRIGTKDLIKYQSARRKAGADSTAKRDMSTIKTMLRKAAHVYKYIPHPPDVTELPKIRLKQRKRPTVTYDQELAMVENAASHLKPILLIGFDCGLRIKDLLALKWSQVDFEERKIKAYNSKSKKDQVFKMTPQVEVTLRKIPGRVGHVFRYRHEPIKSVKNAFAAAAENAGIRKVLWVHPETGRDQWWPTPHDMRRTFATRHSQNRTPTIVIRDLLGHKSVATTEKYLGVDSVDLDTAMDNLAESRNQYLKNREVEPLEQPSTESGPEMAQPEKSRRVSDS